MTKTPDFQLKAVKKYDSSKRIIKVRLTPELAEKVERYAHNNGESLNGLIVRLLEQEVLTDKAEIKGNVTPEIFE